MASLETQTPCPGCDCSDSPLSITGNVLGILTFAVAIYASVIYYYRGFRDSATELADLMHRVNLAAENLGDLTKKFQDDAHKIRDHSAGRRLKEAIVRARDCILEAARVGTRLPSRKIPRKMSLWYAWRTFYFERAAYVLEREDALKVLEKMDVSLRDLKGVASGVFRHVPTEAESRIMDMARVLGEIRAQNTELRVMMGDVARRVTALEGRSGGQTTAPGGDEEEPVKAG